MDDEAPLDMAEDNSPSLLNAAVWQETDTATGAATVHYHFPVEIEVRSTADPLNLDELIETTLARLAQSLGSV